MASDHHHESMLRSLENAHRLLSSRERAAFDLSKEPKASLEKYSISHFGQGCPGSKAIDQSRAKTDRRQQLIHYGLHRHFTGSVSVVMFGGGMKKGFLYGETAKERPLVVTKDPVSIMDLHATILTAMGVSP